MEKSLSVVKRGTMKIQGEIVLISPLLLKLTPVKYIGKIVSYQGLVFFLPAVVLKIPDLGTKSTTTGILVINKGNNIGVDPSEIYECIAPVGGRTCLTAGERSEPADSG